VPDADELEPPRNACAECGRERGDEERGWKAYLTVDHNVAVFCPECAAISALVRSPKQPSP
jgi:hypothetical protein